MLKAIFLQLCFYSLFMFSISGKADLTPGARYFTGKVKVAMSEPTKCFVEALYSGDGSQITARSILTLPHLSASSELIWAAVGPYTANYLPTKSLYRYQDTTVAAPVKDMVIQTVNMTTPTKFAVLYWHAEAGHHDPITCEDLVESTTPEQLVEADDAFADFDKIKASHP